MRHNCLPSDKRKCPHCGESELAYYHEIFNADRYYCRKCYGMINWDGKTIVVIDGEAYPDRKR